MGEGLGLNEEKTPRRVSKDESSVETSTRPEAVATHSHQTECPPGFPAMMGSRLSMVAPAVSTSNRAGTDAIKVRLPNRSFGGDLGDTRS